MKSNPSRAGHLGQYLRDVREALGLKLREVEEAAGVSNAYLSQLETGKVERPSPSILHKLAAVYNVSYEQLMEKAGYLHKGPETRAQANVRLPTSLLEDLTPDEEAEVVRFLAFIKSRRGKH